MASERYLWLRRLKAIDAERRLVSRAVDHLSDSVARRPDQFPDLSADRGPLAGAAAAVPETDLLRTFVASETAVRALDRRRRPDAERPRAAAELIDSLVSAFRVPIPVRGAAHEVRRVCNRLAHDLDASEADLTPEEARRRLARFLSHLPEDWP